MKSDEDAYGWDAFRILIAGPFAIIGILVALPLAGLFVGFRYVFAWAEII